MADVADHFFLSVDQIFEEEEDAAAIDDYYDGDEEGEVYFLETLEPAPFWSFHSASAIAALSDGDEVVDYVDAGALPPFMETLDSHEFRLLDGADDMGSDYLGLGFDEPQEVLPVSHSDCTDGFLLRRSLSQPASSGDLRIAQDGQGLRVVGFGTDSDSDDDGIIEGEDNDDVPPLLWNCLRIYEETVAGNEVEEEVVVEDLEWEDVNGRLDERVVISMLVGAEEEEDDSTSGSASRYGQGDVFDYPEVEDGDVQVVANLDWELLLAMNHSGIAEGGGGSPSPMMETDEHETDLVNTSEYEVLFGQFLDHISPVNGSPPAAKLVVESLPLVAITKDDVANNKTLCAVCKDEMSLEEKVRRLPCSHLYHGDCILPWLGIRNTCPVCRYELPTDDLEYENWRGRRAPGAHTAM